MKTRLQHSFSQLENKYLEQLLPQLIHSYSVVQLFYTPQTGHEQAHLVLHMEIKKDVEVLQKQAWVDKLQKHHTTFVHFFYNTQLQRLFKNGNPFTMVYCRTSSIIYENETHKEPQLIDTKSLKKQLKKVKGYKERFHHDHDLLRAQITPLLTTDCSGAILFFYESLLAFDLDYLEALYLGTTVRHKSLSERIATMAGFAPEIQTYFVKQSGNSYFLTNLINKAKEAAKEGECLFASEHYEAFRIAEEGLFQRIEKRFMELQQRMKQKKLMLQLKAPNFPLMEDEVLKIAVATIQKSNIPEEIYMFHKTIYGESSTYYLLLIGSRLSNALLKNLSGTIQDKAGPGYTFVLIGHTRAWIQEWLYGYQPFFTKSMKKENLLFASSPFHAVPHWEVPYTPEYPDLEHYYSGTEKVYHQILLWTDCDTDNFQGIANLFSLFFLSFCRTYVYATISYFPNYLNSFVLWQLCLYANPELKRYDFLFQDFKTPIFRFLDHHSTVHPISCITIMDKKAAMLAICKKLMQELKVVVC